MEYSAAASDMSGGDEEKAEDLIDKGSSKFSLINMTSWQFYENMTSFHKIEKETKYT